MGLLKTWSLRAGFYSKMKKIIITSMLLFAVETTLHTLMIAVFLPSSESNEFNLVAVGYIKLKTIFYLLPYLITYTHLLKIKEYNLFKFGIIQILLFVGLSMLLLPIGGILLRYFISFFAIAGFLLCSFLTPFITIRVLNNKLK